MSDKIFLDTNILVYSYSDTEPEKQSIARKLIANNETYISTQVLQELLNTLTRKFDKSWEIAKKSAIESSKNNTLFTNNLDTIAKACQIADKYKYSFYDSLIISSALSCNCNILYSEDMHHGQIIENSLKIINPFG